VLYVDDVTVVDGLHVTTAARTLVDLAAYRDIDTSLLRRMLDECAVRRLCLPDDVAASLERCGTHRRGSVRLRMLVAERVQADSHLEQVWLRRLVRAGLRPPEVGFQLVIDGSVLVLDFAWPEHRVAIEVDGWRPHATRQAFDHDRLRDLAAVRAGWTVLRVTSRTPPAQLFATIQQLISQFAPSEGGQLRNQRKGVATRARTAVPAITR
jgi:very-short-patch-repair endonuclease